MLMPVPATRVPLRRRGRRATAAMLTAALLVPLAPVALAMGATAANAATPAVAYRDAALPTKQRVDDLLGRMTLAEKVGQMTQAERADATADPTMVGELFLGSVLS